jgi:formate-dependent phosphoribosylglycinamide formyltransferase (GAR transformylase)
VSKNFEDFVNTLREADAAMRAFASAVAEFNLELMLANRRRVEHARRRALKAIAKISLRGKL